MDIFAGLKTKKIEKGTFLLRKGEICNSAYKVVKGCLKSYIIDNAGKEHILQFAPEDWFITDMDSLFNNKPTFIFIDAIEDSEVIVLNNSIFEKLEKLDSKIVVEQNNRLIRNLISTNKRLIALLSSTAKERYMDFVSTYPSLVKRLPLKLIAAYIGITPEYLSELRRKIVRK